MSLSPILNTFLPHLEQYRIKLSSTRMPIKGSQGKQNKKSVYHKDTAYNHVSALQDVGQSSTCPVLY